MEAQDATSLKCCFTRMEGMVAMRELTCRAVEAASLKGLQLLIGQDYQECQALRLKIGGLGCAGV